MTTRAPAIAAAIAVGLATATGGSGDRNAAPAAAAAAPAASSAPRPTIRRMFIPFGAKRKREMAAYARRHYGIDGYLLADPKVIVEHYSVSASARSVYNTFAPDRRDPELHELPGVCAHFVVDRDGKIYQLVRASLMCRHTVGLNHTAIGIEHAGFSDRDILENRRQLLASLRLTRWLRCRYGIALRDTIGHNESLSSPYHRERVARLRRQTHGDWTKRDMDVYRARLRKLPC